VGVVLALGELGVVEAVGVGVAGGVSIAMDASRRVAAVGDGLRGGGGGLDSGEYEAREAEVEHLLGPDGARLGEAQHGGGASSIESMEAGERLRDVARPVLHVDDDVVVAGKGEKLDKGRVGRRRGGGGARAVSSARVGKKERRQSEEGEKGCTVWKDQDRSYPRLV
jgi:hypothetical protein